MRAQVAEFYRAKGYQVRENPRVRGASDQIYAVEMVASGPLGSLLISFGDAGGVDAVEISRVRTLARDIGATPVIVASELPPELRRMAAQFAVVVLDEATLNGPDGSVPNVPVAVGADLRRDLDQHPWPESGRARADIVTGGEAGGHADVADVDDLLSQLGGRVPPAKERSDGAGLWKRTGSPAAGVVVPAAATPMVEVPGSPAPAAQPPARHIIQQSTAAPVQSAPPAPFSWLSPGKPIHATPPGPTVDDLLGPHPTPAPSGFGHRVKASPPTISLDDAPLLSHEATLQTRRATIGERAGDVRDAVEGAVGDRAGLVKFGLWLAGGAVALFLAIRWLA